MLPKPRGRPVSRDAITNTRDECATRNLSFRRRAVLCCTVPGDLSFPKSRRLTRTAEFDQVRKQGTTSRGALITLAIASAPKDPARLGIITSRKVGNAVVRNRARRRIREIFRKHQHEIKSGIWIVIIVSARAERATYAQLEDEWLRLAGHASILTP